MKKYNFPDLQFYEGEKTQHPPGTKFVLRLFREDNRHERKWCGFVGTITEDLEYLHKQAKKLVEHYCHSHPGHKLYHSEELEYVAEGRNNRVDFGVAVLVSL